MANNSASSDIYSIKARRSGRVVIKATTELVDDAIVRLAIDQGVHQLVHIVVSRSWIHICLFLFLNMRVHFSINALA